MPCIFCSIVAGETPAEIVFEDEISVAFLDHRPVFLGHALLAPRAHVETLLDLGDDAVGPMFANARTLARAVRDGMLADGTFVAINNVVSQSVPHLHVHIVPRRRKDGLRGFFWPRQKYDSAEDMRIVADAIRAAVP